MMHSPYASKAGRMRLSRRDADSCKNGWRFLLMIAKYSDNSRWRAGL